jgi:lipopolysaccharide/colanic/teichoic acid biosynthesis glycosyltransferase
MTALSFRENPVDAALFAGPTERGRPTETQNLQADFDIILWSSQSTFLLAQKASPWALSKWRRLFDCAVAGVAILLSLPLLVAIALLVRLTSSGPVLFRQKRTGRNGTAFTLYKFRSMRTEDNPGSHITVRGDTRVTRIGALLRRYKLDELPQFWNVLKGDMSLVGPRPKLPRHEALLMTARPGITGPATLAFRHEEELLLEIDESDLELFYQTVIKPAKARIDFDYMRNATCRTDLRLLWTTFACCLGCSMKESPQDWQSFITLLLDQADRNGSHRFHEGVQAD